MKKLEINDKLYLLPSKWNELTKENLLEFCRIQLLDTKNSYRKFLLLNHFTGIPFKKMIILPKESLPAIFRIFDFLFEPSQLTINLMGDIFGLKSPDPALTNFTFEQFLGHTEPYAYSIAMGKWLDVDDLINAMYNFNGPGENHKKIETLTDVDKLAIYYFYMGCSNFIKHRFPLVFSGKEEKKTKPDGLEFARLVNSLNLGDVSKNANIKQNNLYESLQFLTSVIEKSQNNGSK